MAPRLLSERKSFFKVNITKQNFFYGFFIFILNLKRFWYFVCNYRFAHGRGIMNNVFNTFFKVEIK